MGLSEEYNNYFDKYKKIYNNDFYLMSYLLTEKEMFMDKLLSIYGHDNIEKSIHGGYCVVCQVWSKFHHYFEEYQISTCLPQSDLNSFNPDDELNYLGKYKYYQSDDAEYQANPDNAIIHNQLIYEEEKEIYQNMLKNQCMNKIHLLLGRPEGSARNNRSDY